MSNFVINKSQTNNIAITLSERSQITSPYFLFVFTSKFDDGASNVVCSVQNQIAQNNRYDLVVIEEKSNPIPLDGEVYLIEGEWSYNVYESVAPTLLVAETTERVLQRGFIIVK